MKSGNNSGEIQRPFQPAEPLTPVTTVSVEREGALEKQFIINFDRRCTILLSEEERDALYSSLGDYRATRQLNPLLDRLSQILNSPIKMELVDDIKHFVEERHLVQFEKGMPFGDLGSKVVKILNSTPSYDVRQRSAATTPRSLTPHPIGDWDRRISKDETRETKRFELAKVDKQQLGFTLWGASEGQGEIFIKHILPQSIADSAGLKPGDRLLDINDTPLDSFSLAQVANLIENSGVLRMRIQRNRASQRLYATPKTLLKEERTRDEGKTALPIKSDPHGKRAATPIVTVSPPSAYISKTFPEVDKEGTIKEGMYGSRTNDPNLPRSRTGTMSSVVSRVRQIPIKTSGHRPPNSDSLDNATLKKYESLSGFPHRRTKTVIDLNGKAVENDSSIRIEEMADTEDHPEIAGTQRTPIPQPRTGSSTLPRSAQTIPSMGQHKTSTSLQMLPNPHRYSYQSSALSSPILGRSTKVIPIIRSYIPQDNIDKRGKTLLKNYTPDHLQNQQRQNISEIQIEQPQLNLVPPQYEQLFQQIQHPRMQKAELNSSVQQFLSLPRPGRARHSSENIIQNERYSQKPQYVHHRKDKKRSLSNTPVPTERYPDPVFPTVIPHYHAIPRRSENHPYLESEFPHPGMWKSMDDIPYLNKKLSPKRNRSQRYLSYPDLSSWSRYGRAYYERSSPTPSNLDEYSERSRNDRYNRPFPSGWRSDRDVEYGITRHYRRGNKYWHHPDRRHEYFDKAQAQFYEDRLRSFREPESLDQWEDTESEYSDFDTVSTAFDSSIERQGNRKYKDRLNRWQNYGPFLDVSNTSRSKGPNVYLSNASQEVLFKKGASTDSEKFRVPIHIDDITSSYQDDEVEFSPRTRRSKHDRLDNSNRNLRASQRKPSRSITSKSSNAYDQEAKATYVKSKETDKTRISKSASKSPKAQPRYHSKTPSISSLSSNFSQTASTGIPLFDSISATNDEPRKANEEIKHSRTSHRQLEKRNQINEMSEDEMNAISLLGYSKLSSPGASLRLKTPSAQNHVYQNVDFNREPTSPRQIDDRLPSSPLIRSDSQSSLTSIRTTKSGHYDFVDATTEFNKSQSQSKNVAYVEKRPTIRTTNEVTSARERIFGRDWQAAQIKPVPKAVVKNESSAHNQMKQDDSWIKHSEDGNDVKPVEQPETFPEIESKFNKDDPKADEVNDSKWSLKDGNKTEKGWSENVLNDGRYKSIAIDSADSGVSVDTNAIGTPQKSPINPPALYPKPAGNQSYAIYQNQSFLSGESKDKKLHLNQSNSPLLQLSDSKINTNTSGESWQRHSEIKWRPMAKQRTFDERQKSLVASENYKKPHNLIKAKLDKTCPYLGLSISGGVESRTCPDIIIDNITRGSAADLEGSLKSGMKLTSVDGQSLVKVTHGEAVRIIKTSFLDKTQRWMDVEAVN